MSVQTTSPTNVTAPTQAQIQRTLMKVMYLGLTFTLGVPLVLLAVGYFVRQGGMISEASQPQERVFLYALLAVAASEIPVALLLKRSFLKPLSGHATGQLVPTTGHVFSRYLILFNLAVACSIYGLVWYLLGGTVQEFALFAVIGLVIFRLVRPSTEFFYSLFGVRPAID